MNCPNCNTELKPIRFNGYYDTFSAWVCVCSKSDTPMPKSTEVCGAYSGLNVEHPDIFEFLTDLKK